MASLDLEQHLKNSSGHGCPAKRVQAEREFLLKRRFSTLGKIKRCGERQGSTKYAKLIKVYIQDF
jgi:hypothetical protein